MSRDRSLETLRGLAALVVLVWHTMLGFFPAYTGAFSSLPADRALVGTPLFALMNGTAAVAFFFVLSGFVLTRRYFLVGDSDFLRRNALKRWPRLAFPVAIVVLLSWSLFALGLYRFEAAAALTQSPWLKVFASAYETPFEIHFSDALAQGLALTFLRGDSYYDSSLWTMRYEFIGSFMAFGFAALLGTRSALWIRLALTAVILLVIRYTGLPWYMAFPVGVLLAAVLPACSRLPLSVSLLGIAIAFYLAGYSGVDRGVFHPIIALSPRPPQPIYVWIVAAVLLIVSVQTNDRIHGLLSRRAGVFFGWISFPLYLIHVPVLCSAGAATFLHFASQAPGAGASVAAAIVTAVVSLLAAIPLAMLNDVWVGRLNRVLAHPAFSLSGTVPSGTHMGAESDFSASPRKTGPLTTHAAFVAVTPGRVDAAAELNSR